MDSFRKQLTACLQNEPPPCSAVCPFGLDIRTFIGHLKRGAFGSAFRLYRDAVAFPGIVSQLCDHPCQTACVFSQKDGAISMRDLEASAIAYAPNTQPNKYSLPARSSRIAIIGAGPSGLACALRLASKKYNVVIFEREERIGGSLWNLLPQEIFMPELERQFQYEMVTFHLSTPVISLSQLQADAIYLATGKDGKKFGMELSAEGACASNHDGVFLGGGVIGRTVMEAIADGLTAAKAIERYLKTGGMNEPIPDHTSRFHPDPNLIPYTPPVCQSGRGTLTKEETVAEANRCQQCQCDACIKYCDLMRSYQKYPKRVEEEVAITIEPVSLTRSARVATRLISTCNHCGLCKKVCPLSLDTGAFLLDSHRIMREKNAMPWAYHEFWLRDMEFSNSEASLVLCPSKIQTPPYLFFPGCRLGGSDPKLVLDSFEALLEYQPDAALYLGCCGAPAEWAGESELHRETVHRFQTIWESLGKPKVVFACLNCREQLSRHLPQIEGITLYQLLKEWKYPIPQTGTGQSAVVFDPCPSREDSKTRQAVRKLAKRAGFSLETLSMEGEYAQCCGWGGQVDLANPKYAAQVTQSRASQSQLPYLVYCANCGDVFSKRGKPSAHLLRAIFPPGAGKDFWRTTAPTASESRENRRWLKAELLCKYVPEEAKHMETIQQGAPLLITPDLLDKMNRSYLLREDAESVVETCERTGKFLINQETGVRVGHAMAGHLTIWVEYQNLEGCRKLINIYAHRMQIVEGAGNV